MKILTDSDRKTVETSIDPRLTVYSQVCEESINQVSCIGSASLEPLTWKCAVKKGSTNSFWDRQKLADIKLLLTK